MSDSSESDNRSVKSQVDSESAYALQELEDCRLHLESNDLNERVGAAEDMRYALSILADRHSHREYLQTLAAVLAKCLFEDRKLAEEAAQTLNDLGEFGVEHVIHVMKDAHPQACYFAIKALIDFQISADGKVAVPILADILKRTQLESEWQDNDDLRAEVIRALYHFGSLSKPAMPMIFEALEDSSPQVRANAAFAVQAINPHDETTLNALVVRLADEHPQVRRLAVEAVGNLAEAIGEHVAPAIPALVATFELAGPDEHCHGTMYALKKCGETAIPQIAGALLHAEPRVRRLAAETMKGFYGVEGVVESLIGALGDEDDSVRFAAAWSLGVVGSVASPALEALFTAFESDRDDEVRDAAARAIGKLGSEAQSIIPRIVELLNASTDERRQAKCIEILGQIDAKGNLTREHLMSALANADPAIRTSAAIAMSRIGDTSQPVLEVLCDALAISDLRDHALSAIKRMGATAEPMLPSLATEIDPAYTRWTSRVLSAISKIGVESEEQVPGLRNLLNSDDNRMRLVVAEVLAPVPELTEVLVPVLLEIMSTDLAEKGVCDVFYRMGPRAKAAIPELVELLHFPDYDVQWAASDALGAMGLDAVDAVPDLLYAIEMSGGRVPSSATHAIVKIGAVAVPELIKSLGEARPKTVEYVADALGQIGPAAQQALPQLEACLSSETEGVRIWAKIALALIDKRPSLVPDLIAVAENSDETYLCHQVIMALGNIGLDAKGALPVLGKFVNHADRRLTKAATDAIEKIVN